MFQGEKDDKIIAVCADDPEYKHFNDIKELAPHRLSEIRRFFEDCILLTHCTILESRGFIPSIFYIINGKRSTVFFNIATDKKNENKEVAVNDFLPHSTATEAIQYSM